MTTTESNIVLGDNQYGKAENHVVRVNKENGDRHTITDITVISQLHGDFEDAYFNGDNAHVVATDTQKNTVFAFSREPFDSPEEFLLRLGRHFVEDFDWVTGGRWAAREATWDRINDHDHAFVRAGTETRTAVVKLEGEEAHVISGLEDLAVLKSTGSGFVGYPRDRYTTLAETEDRILATSVTARWLYNTTDVDWNASYRAIRDVLLESFTDHYSRALQETQYLMGKAVLDAHPEVDEIKFSMPNLHHFVVDLEPFQLDNPNVVFYAAHSPYGQIEGTLRRDGLGDTDKIWKGVPGFV